MIRYALVCGNDHGFDAWFQNSDSCAAQLDAGQVECPMCGTHDVSKALMAPNVVSNRKKTERTEGMVRAALGAVRAEMNRTAVVQAQAQAQAQARAQTAGSESEEGAPPAVQADTATPGADGPADPGAAIPAETHAAPNGGGAVVPAGPGIPGTGDSAPMPTEQEREDAARLIRELRQKVEQSCDYVGDEFAEEARKIHYGETEERPIYGEASPDEAEALLDEGITVAPLPWRGRTNG